jgi:hypothetical protein
LAQRLGGRQGQRARGGQGLLDPSVRCDLEPQAFAREEDGSIDVDVHQVVHDAGSGELVSDTRVVHRWQLEDGLVLRMDVLEPLE